MVIKVSLNYLHSTELSFATLCIGLLPGYSQIGINAVILLIIIRSIANAMLWWRI